MAQSIRPSWFSFSFFLSFVSSSGFGKAIAAGTAALLRVFQCAVPFQCARIGFGGEGAVLGPAAAATDAQADFTPVTVLAASQRPAGRAAGRRHAGGSDHGRANEI